jgi:hypothetical protein
MKSFTEFKKGEKPVLEHFRTSIVRSEQEINDLLNEVAKYRNNGSKFSGMSYEDGLQAMFDWLTEASEENPME